MRALSAFAFFFLAPTAALAQSSVPPPSPPAIPNDFPRLVLETGRLEPAPPEPDLVRLQTHGEYQFRYEHLRSFPLDATATVAGRTPRGGEDSLGQSDFAAHWIRITPRLQIRDSVQLVGQIDLLTGDVLGENAHDTHADASPRDDYDGFKNVQPRWLYAEFATKQGLFRAGQQPNHWGIGLVANDGDHPQLFGDYRYGDIVERVLYAARPAGNASPLVVTVAGDLVFRDQTARLSRGDQALQAVVSVLYDEQPNQLGFYGVYRHQRADGTITSDAFTRMGALDVVLLDVAGKFVAPVAGAPGTFVFGAEEVATAIGSEDVGLTLDRERTRVRAYGGAVQLGVLHARAALGDVTPPMKKRLLRAYGDVVAQVELGYASGDADPYDSAERRFTFNANHKVGLLLFDEVVRWQTARAATAAQDPLLDRPARPFVGIDTFASNGGVFGAEYLNPTLTIRPKPWLDLKAGAVIAQATSDIVDPYRLATTGTTTNYRGGDPKRHDLGVEFDGGVEARLPLDYGLVLALGAQGGLLFPGGALANAQGDRMKLPWVALGRGALMF